MKWFRWLLLLVPVALGLERFAPERADLHRRGGVASTLPRAGTQLLAVYVILALISMFAPVPTS